MPELDRIDRALLTALADDGRASYARLGRQVGLSSPAVAERIARLEDRGVIRGFTVDIDPAALGRAVSAIVEFIPAAADRDNLLARLQQAPEVETLWLVTGEALAVLLVRVKDNDELGAFLERLNAMGRTRTAVILKRKAKRLPP